MARGRAEFTAASAAAGSAAESAIAVTVVVVILMVLWRAIRYDCSAALIRYADACPNVSITVTKA